MGIVLQWGCFSFNGFQLNNRYLADCVLLKDIGFVSSKRNVVNCLEASEYNGFEKCWGINYVFKNVGVSFCMNEL